MKKSEKEIEAWILERLSRLTKQPIESMDPTKEFTRYGVDSVALIETVGDSEAWLGTTLPSTLLFDYDNARGLARFLAGNSEPAAKKANESKSPSRKR